MSADFSEVTGPLEMFWNGSGMNHHEEDPLNGKRYTSDVIAQNMQLIGAVPHAGNIYQRPHNLLALLEITAKSGDTFTYDWSQLDVILDAIVESGQRPFFELMGRPVGSSITNETTDFTDAAKVAEWRIIVRDVALHCEERYGQDEVRTWFFEVWNEPDSWNQQSLLNYYDACSAGLEDADPMLRFGGPGTISPYAGNFTGLIEHCLSGTNYFGGTGTRLDFISYHNKAFADAQSQLDVNVISGLVAAHSELADMLFINDESDSEVGWWLDLEFRSSPWYASFVARQVRNAQKNVVGALGAKFRLANDNSFIGGWGNRTQFTWFGDETNFALIKKPAHNVFTMLAFLGDQEVTTSADHVDGNAVLGAFASVRDTSQAAILLYNYSTDTAASGTTDVELSAENLPFSSGKFVEYRIDQVSGNIRALWESQGSPATPSAVQLQELRDNQELTRRSISDLASSTASTNLALPLGSASLLLYTADPGAAPAAATSISLREYASIVAGQKDVMVSFRHQGWTVKTFEIYFSATSDGEFQRVNTPDILGYGFIHSIATDAMGFYKVRAVDYWDRASGFSDTVGLDGTVIPSPDDPGGSGGSAGSGGANATGGAGVGGSTGGDSSNAQSGGTNSGTAGNSASPGGGRSGAGNGCGACKIGRAESPKDSFALLALAALGLTFRRRGSRLGSRAS
jgi:L-iduronidase